MKCVLVPVAIALQVAAGFAHSSAGPTQGRAAHISGKVLAGRNVFSAARAEVFTVKLPVEASLSFRPGDLFKKGSLVEVRGGGRITGIILVHEHQSEPVFAALKVRECVSPRCTKGPQMKASIPFGRTVDVELPAGKYRLYAIVDGAPIHVTLRLPGLRGEMVVEKGESASLDLRTPSRDFYESDPVTAYAASQHYEFDTASRGLEFSATWVRGGEYKGSTINWCFSRADEELGSLPATSACAHPRGAKGSGGDEYQLTTPAKEGRFVLFTVINLGPQQLDPELGGTRDWNYGFSAISPGPALVGTHAMTLSF